jgi:NAD(P)H-hydrate epimerase
VIPVVSVEEMRAIDAEALKSISEEALVARAGTAVATCALELMGGAYARRVVVLAGKGNNGADGRVAAGILARRGARVSVLDAADSHRVPETVSGVDLLVDAAYGTGFRGTYAAPSVARGVRVLAVDIPSGVTGDSGEACGNPARADRTVTFAALKPGLLQGAGAILAGEVVVADIGIDTGSARIHLLEDADMAMLPERPRYAHKWQSGVAVVAGSPGMAGAALLAAQAAYRAGAGMVRLAVPGSDPAALAAGEAVVARIPAEAWSGDVLGMAERCKALVVGPGLGRGEETGSEVRRVVAESPVPVVIDADGIFALGGAERLCELMAARRRSGEGTGTPGTPGTLGAPGIPGAPGTRFDPDVVVTPHDGEYALLAGEAPGPDRIGAARRLSRRCGAAVLLKGATTVVASPDGRVLVVIAGPPSLATAGSGDVLSGMAGAFVARGVVGMMEAAGLAAHAHGRAAALGPSEGLVAGDLPVLVTRWLSRWRSAAASAANAGDADDASSGLSPRWWR